MKRSARRVSLLLAAVGAAMLFSGCAEDVPQGVLARVKTRSGWAKEVLTPGRRTCYGWDQMYFVDSTQQTYEEPMEILVGGKVNLKLKVQVRCELSEDTEKTKLTFEKARMEKDERYYHPVASHQTLYDTYLKMVVQAVPRDIIGQKTDIQTVVANRQSIAADVSKEIITAAEATPMKVLDVRIVNYDWPDTITDAQEELVGIEMAEKREEAQVRADLKKAEGRLEVEEANILVEAKKAEGIAMGIRIVRDELRECPEYLQWHTVRAMSEAASGPNNAFIMFPYNMPGIEDNLGDMRDTALMNQVLKSGVSTETARKAAEVQLKLDAEVPGVTTQN